MNLPLRASRRLALGVCWAGAVALGLIVAGCSTSDAPRDARFLSSSAPAVRQVPAGTEFAHAKCAAALHEGDFAVSGVGESMSPRYHSGTALVVHPTSFFMLRRGMVVVYVNRRGAPVAHLLVEPRSGTWIAAGINNAAADDERVTPENLVGVVRYAFSADAPRSALAMNGRGGTHGPSSGSVH